MTIPTESEDQGRALGGVDNFPELPKSVVPGSVMFGWLAQPIAGTLIIQQRFFDSFYNFISYDLQHRRVYAGYQAIGTGYIPQGRDEMVALFLMNGKAEWLLSCDWDISFTPESVYALLDAADPVKRPIIAGCYLTWFGKDSHLRPCAMHTVGNLEYVPMEELVIGEVVEVSMVGMGFTLIHRSVFEKMGAVYADDPWHWFGHDIVRGILDGRDGRPVPPGTPPVESTTRDAWGVLASEHQAWGRTGEDLTFADRARRCGFSVWLHGGVQLGHVKSKTIFLDDIGDPHFWANTANQRAVLPRVKGKRLLNVGGHTKNIPLPTTNYIGWEHVMLDVSDGPDVDIVLDARKLADPRTGMAESFDAVVCSHTLEHFYAHEVSGVLTGFNRVLKPGGVVDIWVPNMETVAKALAAGKDMDEQAYISPVGPITLRDIIYGWGEEIEQNGTEFYAHKTGFTKKKLEEVLTEAGFVDVKVAIPKASDRGQVGIGEELEWELWATGKKPVPVTPEPEPIGYPGDSAGPIEDVVAGTNDVVDKVKGKAHKAVK